MNASLRQLLLTGLEHARARRLAEAAAIAEQVKPLVSTPKELQAAAILAFAVDAFHDSVEHLERAALTDDLRARASALELLMHHAGRLGWEPEALAAGARLRALRPSAALDVNELNRLARHGATAAVITRARRVLAGGPSPFAHGVRLELCNALAASFDLATLRDELAVLREPAATKLEEVLERISLHLEADDCPGAEALALEASRQWPERAEPLVWRSRFRRWTGDLAAAETHARAALKLDETSADAWCALGAALNGDATAIDRACALDPQHGEAFTWLADRHARVGDEAKTTAALHVAISSAKRLPVMAWALRSLTSLPEGLDPKHLSYPRFQEVGGFLETLGRPIPTSLDEARSLLELVRTSLCGNYGEQATWLVDGALHRLPTVAREGPRSASRNALELLRSQPLDEVLQVFDAVEQRYPRSSLPACHRAEAFLWAGRLDESQREFERAIALVRGTRFAWIGLTGIATLRGRLDEALRVCAEGVRVMGDTSGPAVFVYRGEALRRAGRLDEAREDLRLAVERTPRRLSATLNLALIDDDPALQDVVFDRAPALCADARDGLVEPTKRQVLERALELMRGNRSSSLITYWAHGRMRLVPNEEGAAQRVHQHTPDELEIAINALRRAR